MRHTEVKMIINSLKEHVASYKSVNDVFIQIQPKETAYSLILEMQAKLPNYCHTVFSTRESALIWLSWQVK